MSQIETRFIEFKHEKYLPINFVDSSNKPFRAKSDILLLDTKDGSLVYVELKESELKSKKTIQSSENALRGQCKHRGLSQRGDHNALSARLWRAGHYGDCLKFGWNHSVYKHALVAKQLAEHDIRYLLVFSTHEPYVGKAKKPFKVAYQSKGIREVLLERELWELIRQGRYIHPVIH
jgi:hypothetical protein